MEIKDALAALTALGHPKRLSIFRRLVEVGPGGRMAGDLAADLGIPGATLSFHLKELSRAEMIESEPRGRFVCYRANFPAMNSLIAFLTENCCGGVATDCAPVSLCKPAAAR